jgi:hypothetical protein
LARCVVAAFCMLGYRGLRAAFLSTDPFARFLAFGIDDGDSGAGVLQHERGAGAAADQGDSAAVYLVGRDERVCDAGLHGRAAECDARDRLMQGAGRVKGVVKDDAAGDDCWGGTGGM